MTWGHYTKNAEDSMVRGNISRGRQHLLQETFCQNDVEMKLRISVVRLISIYASLNGDIKTGGENNRLSETAFYHFESLYCIRIQ